MEIIKIKQLKQGEKLMDIRTGEELQFNKFDETEGPYVQCIGAHGCAVWLVPARIELRK